MSVQERRAAQMAIHDRLMNSGSRVVVAVGEIHTPEHYNDNKVYECFSCVEGYDENAIYPCGTISAVIDVLDDEARQTACENPHDSLRDGAL